MPSFKQCAVLATALVSSVVASPRHAALHKKRTWDGSWAPAAPAAGDFFCDGVLTGLNSKESGAPVALNSDGPYLFDFVNEASCNISLVIWSSTGQTGNWGVLTVNVAQPNITVEIPAGENVTISMNPAAYTEAQGYAGANGSISGAWAAVYPDTPKSWFGGIADTWGEITIGADSPYNTVDVSYLAAMNGHPMTIQTFQEKGGEMQCQSDRDSCVYLCPEGQTSCNGAECSFCDGNTGCMGYQNTGGYTLVTFQE